MISSTISPVRNHPSPVWLPMESEGAEAVVPDLIDFMLYCFYNQIYKAEHLGTCLLYTSSASLLMEIS